MKGKVISKHKQKVHMMLIVSIKSDLK